MGFEIYLTNALQTWGFLEFILPFILIFTLVFAILQKVKILGDPTKDGKKYNVVVALVVGAVTVMQHVLYPAINDPVNIINKSLPQVSIIVVAILMALIIIGLMGKKFELGDGTLSGWIGLIAFAVVIFIFGNSAGWWHHPIWLNFFFGNPDLVSLVIVILVFAMIIGFITKEDKPASDDSPMKQLGKMFKNP